MYGTRDAASNWETRLAGASGQLGIRAGAQFKKSVSQEEENLGSDTRRRLCGDKTKGNLLDTGEGISHQRKHHRGRFGKEHQRAESENMRGRDKDIVSTRSSTH